MHALLGAWFEVDVVDVWTGERASALQRALRLTNESFAERLGTAVRTVAKWNASPEARRRTHRTIGTPKARPGPMPLGSRSLNTPSPACSLARAGWISAAAGPRPRPAHLGTYGDGEPGDSGRDEFTAGRAVQRIAETLIDCSISIHPMES